MVKVAPFFDSQCIIGCHHTCSLFVTLVYTDSNSQRNCTRTGDQSNITAANINNEAVPQSIYSISEVQIPVVTKIQ